MLKKAALVVGVAAAIVGISSPAFAADDGATDIVPPVLGGVLSVLPWQPCAGNQATGVGGSLAASSPTAFEGGCVNASVPGGGVITGAPWQPCAVNQFTGVGGNVALSSPGSFSGGCVNSSTGQGH